MLTYKDLSTEQKELINGARLGENILVDACIGSGKTTAIQVLCNEMSNKKILYLTYNKLLKLDAKEKIRSRNVFVQNYHGFAYYILIKKDIKCGISETIKVFNEKKLPIPKYDMLVIDEYQDIDQEISEMLEYIKEKNPGIQIIAVGDMKQKIYDKTSLDVQSFIDSFLNEHLILHFTNCFRLCDTHAKKLGGIWQKDIKGVNNECEIEYMDINEVIRFLSQQEPSDILCLGARGGGINIVLNQLEKNFPHKFNKSTVYASIKDEDSRSNQIDKSTAIFTTYDSSKGLERPICVVFDYTEAYWNIRANKPLTNYNVLRNIFCVAASRGKQKIIFVEQNEAMLTDTTLSTKTMMKTQFNEPFYMSDMFSFKFKEDIEECFNLLQITKIDKDGEIIDVKSNDELIDLSSCIEIYQESEFFTGYDIDKEIEYAKTITKDKPISVPVDATLDDKILILTTYETGQDRYMLQVETPFVPEEQAVKIHERIATELNVKDEVQIDCQIELEVKDKENENEKIVLDGRADVLHDGKVFEIKFVNELSHDYFLQCASYIVALQTESGILWNVKNNEMFEIRVPDREKFLKTVVKTITKRTIKDIEIDPWIIEY